jgi:hypothetical protein
VAAEYIPVTRDLSEYDRALILKYLDSVVAPAGGREGR